MSRKQILEILSPPIAFHRCLVRVTGSVNAALMLSQALYWTPRTKNPEGWFYKSQKDWEEETGLSRREQDTARKELRNKGLVEEQLKGVPATLYYRVCFDILESSLAHYAILVIHKEPNKISGNSQTSKAENAKLSQRLPENTTKEALAAPAPSAHINLVNQAIEESLKTGEPADDIIARARLQNRL